MKKTENINKILADATENLGNNDITLDNYKMILFTTATSAIVEILRILEERIEKP